MFGIDIITKLREFSAWLCSFIYQVIAWVYELFINISRVEILSSDDIKPIYERITLVLSIIMVFYITFEFVKFVVQPDGIVDKEKGAQKTVLKMVIVVVLIAFVPNIFSLSYKLQNTIFDNQLFSKIILGKQDVKMETFGRDFSANVLSMFYYVDESIEWEGSNGTDCGALDCKQIVSLNNDYLRQNGKLPYLSMGLDEKGKATEQKTGEKLEVYKITFDGIFAIGVGVFVAYMLILYCIDAGVRVAQMTFLQIIAPIPIIGYLSPKKDGIFQKWVKQCITTYLDLFLRVGIIYFVLLVCQILSKSFSDGTIMENATGDMKMLMFIALVMGLLLFAKKAPKMLQELFPSTGAASGNFGLKAGERVAPMAARAIGAGVGGLNAMTRKGMAQFQATRKRNAQIKEKRRAEGKDTSRAAVRQERIQADKDAKAARKRQRQAQRTYDAQQRKTWRERKDLLAAEKELAETKRKNLDDLNSNDATKKAVAQKKIADAEKKLSHAKDAYNVKKSTIAAGSNTPEAKAAGEYASRKSARDSAQAQYDAASKVVNEQTTEREAKEKAVKDAEQELKRATESKDPNAIAQAQIKLNDAVEARDGGMDIYNQERIIAQNKSEISNLNEQISQNERTLDAEREKHASAAKNVTEAQNRLNDVSAQGDREIAFAEAALQQAHATNDKNQIKIATEAVAQAKHNKNMAVARATNEYQDAQQKESIAASNLKQAETNIANENSLLNAEIQTRKNLQSNAETARTQAITARDKTYEQAKQEQAQKQNELSKKDQEFSSSSRVVQEYSDKLQEDYEKARADRRVEEDKVASAAQNGYRPNAVLSGIAGAATGLKTGIKTGFEAQKLEDISKKVGETTKQVKQEVVQHEKWIDAGGTSTVNRVVSKVQQDLGFSTNAQRIEQEIKRVDADIKSLESTNANETAIIQSADKVKDNNIKKMEEGKLNTKFHGEKNEITVGSSTFKIQDGENVSSAYGRLQTDVDVAEEKLKTATQNGENIEQAQRELAEKRQLAKQVSKKLHEESFRQILVAISEYEKDPTKPDPRTNSDFDAGSVQAAYETLWNIRNSRSNPETVKSMREVLSEKAYAAYIGLNPIDSFDIYDEIEKGLKLSTGKRMEKISSKKQEQKVLSGSDAYASYKADDSAGSGK